MGPDWFKRIAVGRNSCYWRFRQEEILSRLSHRARKFFLYALTMEKSLSWYRYLDQKIDPAVVKRIGEQQRNMWSTAAIMHAAGLTVLPDGTLHPRQQTADDTVFGYKPITVEINEQGIKDWKPNPRSKDRFIFETVRPDDYQSAMTKGLGNLLAVL